MKKQLFGFILAGFLLISLTTIAQNNNYPVTTINGKEYYQYTVQQSEGLLSIGRKFKVSADEIIKASPEVTDGLLTGQKILIPVKNKSGKKALAKTTASDDFIQYKVDKKQTLFSICRKFKITEEELIKYNPGIEHGLKQGTVLQIPKQVKEIKKKEPEKLASNTTKALQTDQKDKKQKFTTHTVKPDETLFSISRRYKVDITDILKFNPDAEKRLVVGSELKIPNVALLKSKEIKKENQSLDSNSAKVTTKIVEKTNQPGPVEHKALKIAYILPLMVDQVKKDPNDERFLNFYEGALLAINDAKKRGVSLEIYTFDTDKSEDRINEILNNPELKSVDLIIGPAFSNLVPFVENFAKDNKINTLIPFTSKIPDIDSNPYLFQFNPGQDSELDFFTDLITGKYKNTHIVFAEIQDIVSTDEGKIRVDALQKLLIKAHRNFSHLEITTPDVVNFGSVLKKGEKNLVIFNSDKYAYVSPFINSLISKSKLFDIVLFEQYNWRNQTDKSLHTLYISPFITRFNSSQVNEFNHQYDQYFGKDIPAESPRYDLLGYDLTNYFISLIHHSGNKFGNKINSGNFEKGIQSEPLFERSSNNSGFINQRVYLGEDKAQ